MTIHTLIDLAQRYFVNDLPGSTTPASRLSGILEKFLKNEPLTSLASKYLEQQGLCALGQLARGEITYETFFDIAAREQVQREQIAEAERQTKREAVLASAIEQEARTAEYRAQRELARLTQERDPKYIAKLKNQALRASYGIDFFIEQEHFPKLMNILRRLDEGNRITDDDVLWITTKGRDYFSKNLQVAFHTLEADYHVAEYRRTADPWSAVNASGHLRKCEKAERANQLLASIPIERQRMPKLRSAIATTHGGVMRDLSRLDDALRFGNLAHAETPRDFRPCTLLGAVNFELGNYDSGRDWYAKAIERGANERSIDYDLRGILLRASPAKRGEIKAFLLQADPDRYRWVNLQANGIRTKVEKSGMRN